MILTSTKDPVALTPPWREGQAGAPVFYFRAGTMIERGMMEAELAGPHRAAAPTRYEFEEAAVAGLRALLEEGPDLDHLLDLVGRETRGEVDDMSALDQALLREANAKLTEYYAPYRDLVAQAQRRVQIAPIVALKRFCTGIEYEGVEFSIGRDGLVSDETLSKLTPLEISWAGSQAFAMQFGGGPSAEKNSPPGSQSDASPPPSAADDTSKAAGSSGKRTSGKKTPA